MEGIDWGQALQPVIATIASVVGVLLSAVLVRLLKKYGIEIDAAQQAKLEHFARQAVLRVEERAAAALKEGGLTLSQPSARAKMSEAVSIVREAVSTATANEARGAIEAALPTVGLGATAPVVAPGPADAAGKPAPAGM
jgi:lysozyme family protein